MKLLLFIPFIFVTLLQSDEDSWNLEAIHFTMENDANVDTDLNYTHGDQISLLFSRKDIKDSWLYIPFTETRNKEHFISFAFANQMFTPYEKYSVENIEDDRPYAGWTYFEIALHQATKNSLDSLTTQVGIVGPSAKMEELQNFYHDLIGVRHSTGWDNQLKDELGIQINYMHKWRYSYDKFFGMDSVLVPYTGANLGNVSIKASGGLLYRIGWSIPDDFGTDSIDEGSFTSVPMYSGAVNSMPNTWSFYFNLIAGSNLVIRDIFLDGNTFKESHSIEKEYLNAYIGGGVSMRYKNFTLHYNHQYYTKQYEGRGKHRPYRGYGAATISYNF